MTLSSLARNLQNLTLPIIQGETQKIIQNDPIIKREKIDEFRAGELPDGSRIGEYASDSYRLFKIGLNPLARGFVDLILTGAYTGALFVERVESDRYRFNSTDEKAEPLRQKYGDEIRGLNEATFRDLETFEYRPEIIEWLNNQLVR